MFVAQDGDAGHPRGVESVFNYTESIDALRSIEMGKREPRAEAGMDERKLVETMPSVGSLASTIYLRRNADRELEDALGRFDSFVLLQGPRQTGKSTLLRYGLDRAQDQGARIVRTDFCRLPEEAFETLASFLRALADDLAHQLGLDDRIADSWREERSPNKNLERYLSRSVLASEGPSIVWGWDDVDRLVDVPYGAQVFSLLRTWHNKRALDSRASWDKIAVVMTHRSEPQQFITDINQSPFNVGTRIRLLDFTRDEVGTLCQRYGHPLPPKGVELESFYALFGGHPALTQWGLQELTIHPCSLDELRDRALSTDGGLRSHWQAFRRVLDEVPQAVMSLREVAKHNRCTDLSNFSRLRTLGLISGQSATTARLRCELYRSFIRRRWP